MLPYHEDLLKTQADMRAQSEKLAHEAAVRALSVREAHWEGLEAGWAADRRRAAGLTPEDSRRVEYFLRWLRHVDGLRTTHPDEAVAAHGRMHAEFRRLDPPDADGSQRLSPLRSARRTPDTALARRRSALCGKISGIGRSIRVSASTGP